MFVNFIRVSFVKQVATWSAGSTDLLQRGWQGQRFDLGVVFRKTHPGFQRSPGTCMLRSLNAAAFHSCVLTSCSSVVVLPLEERYKCYWFFCVFLGIGNFLTNSQIYSPLFSTLVVYRSLKPTPLWWWKILNQLLISTIRWSSEHGCNDTFIKLLVFTI